jgi:hypothetical protein
LNDIKEEAIVTTADIKPGVCGFKTQVKATMKGDRCELVITSECESIKRMAEHLKDVDPFNEISFRGNRPEVLVQSEQHCAHVSCPVPVGILKAIEVEAGLALPQQISIEIKKNESE